MTSVVGGEINSLLAGVCDHLWCWGEEWVHSGGLPFSVATDTNSAFGQVDQHYGEVTF